MMAVVYVQHSQQCQKKKEGNILHHPFMAQQFLPVKL